MYTSNPAEFFLQIDVFHTNLEKIKTRVVGSKNFLFSPEIVPFMRSVEKYTAERTTEDNTGSSKKVDGM